MKVTNTTDEKGNQIEVTDEFQMPTQTREPFAIKLQTSKLFTKPVYNYLSEQEIRDTPGESTVAISQQLEDGSPKKAIAIPIDQIDFFIEKLKAFKTACDNANFK